MKRQFLNFYSVSLVTAALVYWTSWAHATQFQLDQGDRRSLALTVYNNNLAVIDDRRVYELPRGDIELHFSDVAMTLLPPTVSLKSDDRGFTATQQNFRFDLLNRQTLLEKFVGRKLKYSRFLLKEDAIEKVLREGILLSLNPEIVQFGDVIEVEPEGTISLPYLPEGLQTSPTLVFLGKNGKTGEQEINVRYHASGVSWEADYALTLDKKATLDGWVTLRNQSGSDFDVQDLRLVSGQLNQVTSPQPMMIQERAFAMDAAGAPAMKQSAVGDYHAYDFPDEVIIKRNDTTQLRLIQAEGISFQRTYKVRGVTSNYGNQGVQDVSPEVWVSFKNARSNNLDEPMPAGTVRVYEVEDGRETFVGENRVGHTRSGSTVDVLIGRAFDLSATRTQTSFRRLGERTVQVAYEIEVSNSRKSRETVILEEKMTGDWALMNQSMKGNKVDSATYEFELDVPAKGSASVSYELRINW
ncbi:MAG: DUF4139 domain-containing protein [Pseudomonadales bacterium]|nr:DUF4139 domain-containing protein [Pseudomonadales bacterium]MBO7007929.1 DUF4139 domain-containing protein [Pseudomonadales bacterium]